MDFCSWSGILLSVCSRKWYSDLRFLSSGYGRRPSFRSQSCFFWYRRRYAGCPGHYPCHGHHRCTARSGWSRTIIHLPASSDQSHARRKNNCYYLLCCCLFGRYVLSDEPLWGSYRHRSGENRPRKKSILSRYRSHRHRHFPADPGHCLRLDGCTVHLHLPSWCRSGRHYVLLGPRQKICG